VDAAVDLPFALPTSVAGLTLATVYSDEGVLGAALMAAGIDVVFTRLGVAVAMVFVSFPFVVRTMQPVLQVGSGLSEVWGIGDREQEGRGVVAGHGAHHKWGPAALSHQARLAALPLWLYLLAMGHAVATNNTLCLTTSV
jgi:hypothetical protein